MLHRT
jgi:hypothetical protein